MIQLSKMAKTLGLVLILALLVVSLAQFPAAAQDFHAGSKISSLLALQVDTKLRLQRGELPESMASILELGRQPSQLDALSPRTEDLTTQRIFIRLSQPPSPPQIEQLQALGITLYLDSWIPPLENHPTGFLVADMPVDKLTELAARDYVLGLDSAERTLQPQNDLGAMAINAPDVWSSGYDGSGIAIAVLDSGLDLTHPDIPTPIAAKDYSDWPYLDDTIANKATGHGTHVTGIALGRGTLSAGQYQGIAPGSDLVFLKIGNDQSAGASTAAAVNAIKAAVDIYGADIITMSYGGWDLYHDGTSQEAQAADYAFSQGVAVFFSAGNEAAKARHYSGTVAAGAETDYIPVTVAASQFLFSILYFDLVWYDGLGTTNDLDLHYYDSSYRELTDVSAQQSESPRGTESELSCYKYIASPGAYYLKVANNSASSQYFHIYEWTGWSPVTFTGADSLYTISTPADADDAVAVGAYTTRQSWTNYQGQAYSYPGEIVGTATSFTSRGPRVDGVHKPNILAPACLVASCRDRIIYPWPYYNTNADIYPYHLLIIDNDGLNDGNGPADYFLMAGTSMASPMAAGAAALLLQAHPELQGNPASVIDRLQQTATMAQSPDYISGYGVVDAYQAIASQPVRKGDLDNDGHIDIYDFVLFAAAYGSELGDDNYDPVADFDNDGDIDILDFVNFAQVYGT